jgi:GDP-L-fucose synthase
MKDSSGPLTNTQSRIFVAGHKGLVGSAVVRELHKQGFTNLLLRTRAELDLQDEAAVRLFFEKESPEYVILAAAKVGGILANDTCPADFIRVNLAIQLNVIESARRFGVRRLLFLGSSCIYPKLCPQPIREEYLLTGSLEATNRPYSVAKIAGIEMCWSYNRQFGTKFLGVMPTNLYGPEDNFDLQTSHVLPALLRKIHFAIVQGESAVDVWGSGTPRRELLYCDDLAAACVYLLGLDSERFDSLLHAEQPPLVNIGTGEDLTIREIAEMIARILGFDGEFVFDLTKPDGTPRKLLDVSRIQGLGWRHKTSLEEGIHLTYEAVKDRLAIS